MSTIALFVQVHGKSGLHELELAEAATLGELHAALEKLGIKVDAETFVFIDEADQHESGQHCSDMPQTPIHPPWSLAVRNPQDGMRWPAKYT
jgi:hypothetical protein